MSHSCNGLPIFSIAAANQSINQSATQSINSSHLCDNQLVSIVLLNQPIKSTNLQKISSNNIHQCGCFPCCSEFGSTRWALLLDNEQCLDVSWWFSVFISCTDSCPWSSSPKQSVAAVWKVSPLQKPGALTLQENFSLNRKWNFQKTWCTLSNTLQEIFSENTKWNFQKTWCSSGKLLTE